MSSDNRISDGKPRLSLRITRNPNMNNNNRNNGVSFTEGDLMSPKTRSVSLSSSSSSKEVPRAALNHSPPSTSDFAEIMTMDAMDTAINAVESQQNHRNLIEDSIQGLEALAASAAAASSPIAAEFNEDEILGNIFNSSFDENVLIDLYKKHCSFSSEAMDKLNVIIDKSDELLKSKGISMSLKNIFPLYIERIIQQEVSRTTQSDFSNLLMDEEFLSSSATVILMVPRLISILYTIEEVSTALDSNLFDVLLSIEQVLRALPELQKLPATQKIMQELQNILLEDLVWKVSVDVKENTLYKLMKMETSSVSFESSESSVASTLKGIRSCQKALETLSGFPISGVRLTRLELFFRKYLRLAAQRLQYATIRLGLSQSIIQLSWELFFELVQQNDELFKNRHLNQILLSIIYCTSHLLEDNRTFQQISQVLPSAQSQSTWLNGFDNEENGGDFYAFYNEKFLPPLRKKIESFLKKRDGTASDGMKWILNGLFTSAPFPLNHLHYVTPNITLNRLNQPKPQSKLSSQKYEWINPIGSPQPQVPIPQTPNSTSQLFNLSTAPVTPHKRYFTESSDTDDFRLKKVARRLDFSDEIV